jgi:hypothetical protein
VPLFALYKQFRREEKTNSTPPYPPKKNQVKPLVVVIQDWPDSMSMDEAMFEKYAQHLEWEDFEEEVS